MTQLFQASTLYQVASLAAMIDDGAIPDDGERVLLLVDSARQPELSDGIAGAAGFASLAARFDRVVDLGALLLPYRPHQFSPREEELVLWRRLLSSHLDLPEHGMSLYLESIQVNPGRALARIWFDAPISLHSDGLMGYGPLRSALPPSIGERLDAVLTLDLVPGLRPLLAREFSPAYLTVPLTRLATVMGEFSDAVEPSAALRTLASDGAPKALILGQYLVELGLIDAEEDADLASQMIEAAVEAGAVEVVFKPHPSAAPSSVQTVLDAGEAAGVAVHVVKDAVPAELVYLWLRPLVTLSVFSTALVTLREGFGAQVRAVGTELLLERIAPYENSNRIPLTLIDALLVRGLSAPSTALASTSAVAPAEAEPSANSTGAASATDAPEPASLLQGLVDAVGYCMRSAQLPALRGEAADFLLRHPELRDRYVKQKRLRALDLPRRQRPRTAEANARERLRDLGVAVLGQERAVSARRAARRLRRAPQQLAASVGQNLVSWSKRGSR